MDELSRRLQNVMRIGEAIDTAFSDLVRQPEVERVAYVLLLLAEARRALVALDPEDVRPDDDCVP